MQQHVRYRERYVPRPSPAPRQSAGLRAGRLMTRHLLSPGELKPPDMDDTTFATGPDTFRAAMRHHAKGVAVITAGAEHPVGFCATSLASVSLEPPVVSFTVG